MTDNPVPTGNPPKRDIAKQWTPKLKEAGFTAVADAFLLYYREMGITNMEALLIIHLMRWKWNEQPVFPNFKTLGNLMGLTDEQVRLHARNLAKKGFLRKTPRVGQSSLFYLEPLMGPLEVIYDRKLATDPNSKPARRQRNTTKMAPS